MLQEMTIHFRFTFSVSDTTFGVAQNPNWARQIYLVTLYRRFGVVFVKLSETTSSFLRAHFHDLGTPIKQTKFANVGGVVTQGSALFKYCKYTRAYTKGVLFRTSMYKMYVQETYCY